MQGQIIKALAGFYYVESDGQVYQTRARGNFRKKGHTPYVGDWVDFSCRGKFRRLYPQNSRTEKQSGSSAYCQYRSSCSNHVRQGT